jgi:hypothetical protein
MVLPSIRAQGIVEVDELGASALSRLPVRWAKCISQCSTNVHATDAPLTRSTNGMSTVANRGRTKQSALGLRAAQVPPLSFQPH